jgi:hypothetical protein
MRVQGTSAFKWSVAEMGRTWGHDFQRWVHEKLQQLWTDVYYAPDLVSRLDRAGIDLYRGTPKSFDLVVQCKGMQAPIEGKHLPEIRRSIRKFGESGFEAEEYWLVFNHPVLESDMRDAIQEDLDGLVSLGKARSARWLNPNQFLLLLFTRLLVQLKADLPQRNRGRLDLYAARMRGGREYMPDVPCTRHVRRGRSSHGRAKPAQWRFESQHVRAPLRLLDDDLCTGLTQRRAASRNTNSSAYRFVLSDFGFGKTSLLLQLAAGLPPDRRPSIYVPIVELSSDAFYTEHNFVAALFALLYPEHADRLQTARYIPLQVFRLALRSDPSFVLVLDGLDEHRLTYTTDGLTRLFRAIRDLACDVVISARREFWETSRGNLEVAMKEADNDREFYILLDWDVPAMLAYLDEFPRTPGREAVRRVIEDDRYEQVYGDIPKRPLFLEMLVEDAEGDLSGRVRLLDLYTRCLARKLERDISTPFEAEAGISRPLPALDLDLGELRKRLFRMLVRLAGRMFTIDPDTGQALLTELAPERELVEAADESGLGSTRSVYLLLHSVLSPAGTEFKTGSLMLRFAHRSYQEYFLAHHLHELGLEGSADSLPLVRQFLAELRGAERPAPNAAENETFLL